MSLPVLHSAAGYGVYRLSKGNTQPPSPAILIISVVLANFPDLDFLPGIMLGHAALYHRGMTHSLLAAIMVAFAAAGLVWLWQKKGFFKNFLTFSGAYLTHLVLDWWTSGSKGLHLLWPFINVPFYSPFARASLKATHPLDTASGFQSFISAVFSPLCLSQITVEVFICLFFAAVFTAAGFFGRMRRDHLSLVFTRCAAAVIFFVAAIAAHHS